MLLSLAFKLFFFWHRYRFHLLIEEMPHLLAKHDESRRQDYEDKLNLYKVLTQKVLSNHSTQDERISITKLLWERHAMQWYIA